ARVVLKYRHSDGSLCIKVTDDLVQWHLKYCTLRNVIAGGLET
uniref:Signal recognition particle 9 n=1 Tax=Propithecus coquereli TaxID=379532 RepID=A0A2K6G046_PROCO